jgi:hypothetical protein
VGTGTMVTLIGVVNVITLIQGWPAGASAGSALLVSAHRRDQHRGQRLSC